MNAQIRKPAILALEDGRVFRGWSFGAEGEAFGEVIFNTSMTGYQEIFTDPSYRGQLVTLTYPHIGNVGVNDLDYESVRPFLAGVIVREYSRIPSSWRAQKDLSTFLKEYGIPAIEGIDTRALTRHIRERGAMTGVISTVELDPEKAVEKAKNAPKLEGRDLVQEVTRDRAMIWHQGIHKNWLPLGLGEQVERRDPLHILVYDFGVKYNILRSLAHRGCRLTVVPAQTSAAEALAQKPDGIFLSNGPGDPFAVKYAIETTKQLFGKVPMFGICLGHQIMALALGAKTFKMKFGHHGANHPVKNLKTGYVEITAQNHGFAVDIDSLVKKDVEVTHLNLNDQTLEGFRHKNLPLFAVQYHPEASPGPHDSQYLFDEFVLMVESHRRTTEQSGVRA